MTLKEYFFLAQIDRNQFAKEIGVDPITVYRWEKSKRFPREHIRKIMEVTDGKVTANDFIEATNTKQGASA